MVHKYTESQAKFIRENIKGTTRKELTEMFNTYFELNLKATQIIGFLKNNGLNSGLDSRFKKGHAPNNKGMKGIGGWKPTQFRKGSQPHNYLPVGSEIVNTEGYIQTKIADPHKWRFKHLLIWEEHNGIIPKDHVVIFGDGNRLNLDINNLILISKKQLLTMNRHKLIQNDADLTRTGIIIADLYQKISEIKVKNKSPLSKPQ